MAFAECFVCQHRISLIEVFAITHQHFRIGNLDQFTEVFAGIYVADSKVTSCLWNRMVFFPVIQRIDFCTADSGYVHQTIWSTVKETFICAVNQPWPVGKYQSSAVFYVSAQFFFVSVFKHICHRSCQDFVVCKVMFHCNNVNIQPLLSQCTIVFLYVFVIMHIFISRSLYICDRPVVFTVIENRCQRFHVSSNRFLNLFQSFSNLCHFTENTSIVFTVMIDHRTVEFLWSTLTLTELEIQNTVWTVSNCLKRSSQKHSRFLKFIDRFPVRCRRAGFHKNERSLLDAAHQVMLHRRINGCDIFFFFVPSRIVIPGDNIENIFEFLIIQAVIIIHQVCRYRQFWTALTDCIYFIFDKVDRLVCHKTFPVKFQSMKFIFTFCGRTFNLIKTVVDMTPECGTPAFVEVFNRTIFLFQPLSELRLTQWAVAFTAKFIGNMPQHNCRMFAESFR